MSIQLLEYKSETRKFIKGMKDKKQGLLQWWLEKKVTLLFNVNYQMHTSN